MNTKLVFAVVIVLIIVAGGLFYLRNQDTGPGTDPTPPGAMPDDSGATPEGIMSVVDANNQFAFELYDKLKEDEGNIFFSPYSITNAMAMVYEGAKDKTAKEIEAVFHYPADDAVRRSSFAALYNEINQPDARYQLKVANALWAQADYQFLEDYLSTVKNYYAGEANNVDFISDIEATRKVINGWVENKTNSKIKDLFPEGLLNQQTRLVLTNAIYFKGTWVKQFDKSETKTDNFKLSSGNEVEVKMMQKTDKESIYKYAENDDLQILEMPYEGDNLSMTIYLPKKTDLPTLENNLTLEKINEWKAELIERRVDIFMPRFTFGTKYSLNNTLATLGMPTAFTDQADFSGMDGTTNLSIQQVIHQAFVDVNEEGTEAAAATGISVGITSAGPEAPVFRADHPFLFTIQDKNGDILFIGRVSDPS